MAKCVVLQDNTEFEFNVKPENKGYVEFSITKKDSTLLVSQQSMYFTQENFNQIINFMKEL